MRATVLALFGLSVMLATGCTDPRDPAPGSSASRGPVSGGTDLQSHLAVGSTSGQQASGNGTAPPKGYRRGGQLVSDIMLLQMAEGEEATEAEKRKLAEAIYFRVLAEGRTAVPEVLDFLAGGEDVPLRGEPGTDFDFRSLRLALIDALERVGGAAIEQAFLEEMASTRSTVELEALAGALERLQPGAYASMARDLALQRLSELVRAADQSDVLEFAPLFRILEDFGGAEVLPVLATVPYWLRDYATIAAANLQNGEGIEPLYRAARQTAGEPGENLALHLLAQLAGTRPAAQQALLELAEEDLIPADQWPLLADVLIGDRQLQLQEPPADPLQIGSLRGSNPFAVHTINDRQVQVIYSVNYSSVLSAQVIAARLDFIDRLLQVVSNPAAQTSIWAARDLLERRIW